MTTEEKVINTTPGLLNLAQQLGNISQACRVMGYSRDSFYCFKQPYLFSGCQRTTSIRHIRCPLKPLCQIKLRLLHFIL